MQKVRFALLTAILSSTARCGLQATTQYFARCSAETLCWYRRRQRLFCPTERQVLCWLLPVDRVEDAKSCNSCGRGIVSCPSFSSFGFRWHSTRHSLTTTRQWSFLNILMIEKHCLSAQTRKGDYRTADGRVKVISITKVIVSGMTLAWRLVSEMQSSPTSHFRSQIIIRWSVRSDDR